MIQKSVLDGPVVMDKLRAFLYIQAFNIEKVILFYYYQ